MKKVLLFFLSLLAGFVLTLSLAFFVRRALAGREIQREWENLPTGALRLETTSRLEIVPLYEEASTGAEWVSGHGVSYLIRTDSTTILMDVGHNPERQDEAPFMRNLQALGIDWDEIDAILISHPHPDHLGGLDAYARKTVSFGKSFNGSPDKPLFVPVKLGNPGAIVTQVPVVLSPDMGTTGVLPFPEVFPLSLLSPKGAEQALVVNVAGQGLVVITGCGHPTVEKLVARAEALYGVPVAGIAGGLHYEGFSAEDVQPHIDFLRSRSVQLAALSPHDSSPQALEAFQSAFGEGYHTLRVGESVVFP
jgi:7,8-dihydropterin-6-yl-methyl-4-(beta-D-ribofuranosyl)aminobenzene 5'-phosphate synthase